MTDRPFEDMARGDALEDFAGAGEAGLVEGRVGTGAAERTAFPLPKGDGLDKHTRVQLLKEEQAIAARYMADPRKMRIYTVITLSCFAMWLAFFPLTMLDIVPLWPCFVLSCVFAAGGYITSHEAMHDNIGRRGTRYRLAMASLSSSA